MLELCQASMDELFLNDDDERKYRGPMPHSKKDALYQLANGLEYIHFMKLIHREIKPANALVWVGDNKVLMKWADFGLTKRDIRYTNSMCNLLMENEWRAPELLEKSRASKHYTTKSDVFSEGIVFAYFLLDGKHPYGSDPSHEIPNNISKGNTENLRGNN